MIAKTIFFLQLNKALVILERNHFSVQEERLRKHVVQPYQPLCRTVGYYSNLKWSSQRKKNVYVLRHGKKIKKYRHTKPMIQFQSPQIMVQLARIGHAKLKAQLRQGADCTFRMRINEVISWLDLITSSKPNCHVREQKKEKKRSFFFLLYRSIHTKTSTG